MSLGERKIYKQLFLKIREILNEDWDPIGGCPDDEYDSYATKICSMLINDNADIEKIARYLHNVEKTSMGFDVSAASSEPLERIGEKIIQETFAVLKK